MLFECKPWKTVSFNIHKAPMSKTCWVIYWFFLRIIQMYELAFLKKLETYLIMQEKNKIFCVNIWKNHIKKYELNPSQFCQYLIVFKAIHYQSNTPINYVSRICLYLRSLPLFPKNWVSVIIKGACISRFCRLVMSKMSEILCAWYLWHIRIHTRLSRPPN